MSYAEIIEIKTKKKPTFPKKSQHKRFHNSNAKTKSSRIMERSSMKFSFISFDSQSFRENDETQQQ